MILRMYERSEEAGNVLMIFISIADTTIGGFVLDGTT